MMHITCELGEHNIPKSASAFPHLLSLSWLRNAWATTLDSDCDIDYSTAECPYTTTNRAKQVTSRRTHAASKLMTRGHAGGRGDFTSRGKCGGGGGGDDDDEAAPPTLDSGTTDPEPSLVPAPPTSLLAGTKPTPGKSPASASHDRR